MTVSFSNQNLYSFTYFSFVLHTLVDMSLFIITPSTEFLLISEYQLLLDQRLNFDLFHQVLEIKVEKESIELEGELVLS
jgi:hypothetical protein